MLLLWLCLWSVDTLQGVRFTHTTQEGENFCLSLQVHSSDKPLFLVVQEESPRGEWIVLKKVTIDRWSLPKRFDLCPLPTAPSAKLRVVLQGPTLRAGHAILYEGYPKGAPPKPTRIDFERTHAPLLRLHLPEPGQYVLRCYNRFGEEVFTIPIENSAACERVYTFPQSLRGAFLVRLYEAYQGQILAEKSLSL